MNSPDPKPKAANDPAAPDPAELPGSAHEYSVDELARQAKTTVRNVRAYQDRGLLPPPERRGRIGVYTDAHLARLRIVGQLLARGYTLANIAELLEAWERGHELGQLLGLETAVASPWSDEAPAVLGMTELLKMFGAGLSPAALAKAIQLELLIPEGTGFRAPSLRMLRAGAELVAAGVPLDRMLDVIAMLRSNVERVADAIVQLIVEHVFDRYGRDRLPPVEAVPGLASLVWRLRPLVEMAVHPEVARAMEKSANKFLGERLALIMEHFQRDARRPTVYDDVA